MTWVIFDEADHYTPAPYFCLPGFTDGISVCLQDYHEECNLVLVFPNAVDRSNFRHGLDALAAREREYRSFDAKILVVLSQEGDLADESWRDLPFRFVLDVNGKTRREYTGLMAASLVQAEDSLIFVLDRYNAPYSAWIGRDFSDPSVHKDIQSWLAFIGVQCPE
jgi:hypothetical protein